MAKGKKTAPYPFILFENRTDRDIHIVFLTARRTLEMHLYDKPQPTSVTIKARETRRLETAGIVARCIKDNKLSYWMKSHRKGTTPPTAFVPAAECFRDPDGRVLGPIFRFEYVTS